MIEMPTAEPRRREAGRPVRRMVARDPGEPHRVATELELFFDLCFVVAIALAGKSLAADLAEGHWRNGLVWYLLAFFAIWWAWVNFAWFASAYDTDDVPYRLTVLVQIVGALVLAAGVPRLFAHHDPAIVVAGYSLMRMATVGQWLRAAAGTGGPARTTALRYALGITVCQIGWLVSLALPHDVAMSVLPVLALAELSVPAVSERDAKTTWHPHHIAERYGLFTLIVLGESVSAATIALQGAFDEHESPGELVPIAVGGILICFTAWWIYFARPVHDYLRSNRQAFLWGYGHYLVFASAAAIGAGLEVAVEQVVGKAHISAVAATGCVTVPTALYLLTVWALHTRHALAGAAHWVLPIAAFGVLACTFVGEAGILPAGLIAVASVATGIILDARANGFLGAR